MFLAVVLAIVAVVVCAATATRETEFLNLMLVFLAEASAVFVVFAHGRRRPR